MAKQKYLSAETERAYQHYITKGKTLKKTAEIIKVTPRTISRWAVMFGWQKDGNANPKVEQAHRLYAGEGKPLSDVATAVGISPETLTRWIKEYNWKRAGDFKYRYEIEKITFAGFRDFLKANHSELSAQIDETIELYIDLQKRYETQVQEKINS